MTTASDIVQDRDLVGSNGGPPPLPLADVLGGIEEFVRHYVVIRDAQAAAVVLWTAHTWVYDAFDQTPYLSVSSAEKRSGKSRLLDVLALLVARPWRAVTPTEAVVYRKIEADRPTLLLDEVDAIFGTGQAAAQHEGLRALLNAGNRDGTTVPRCVGQANTLVEFKVFCPKVLAGIGGLPETVADRAIGIRMRRKAPGELEARFRTREARAAAIPLAASLSAWGSEAVDVLADARPELPDELNDRAQEAWEPLLAVADLAGGDWPARARRAAVELAADADEETVSFGVRLLADVLTAFDESDTDALKTTDLLAALKADEEAPWSTWRKDGLNPRGLAQLLKPYGVTPTVVRIGDSTPRGYRRADFEDLWPRYLPASCSSLESATTEGATEAQRFSHAGMRVVADVSHVAHSEGEQTDGQDERP